MTSNEFKAGQTYGQAQAKTAEVIQSGKGTATAACDKTAQVTKDTTQSGTGQNPNFLQQTGGQVMGLAQGALDGVKNTLGMGDKK